jgi:hypothetical protein
MADPHAHGTHDHGHDHATSGGGWFSTFVLSLGLFLGIWLTVLYIGHTLASSVAD